MEEKEIKEQNEKCVPIVRKILKEIANYEDGEIGEKREQLMKSYQPVASKVLGILLEDNVKVNDINFIQQALLEPFGVVNEIVAQSMNKHLENLQNKAFGKQPRELFMQELDGYLQDKISIEFKENSLGDNTTTCIKTSLIDFLKKFKRQ